MPVPALPAPDFELLFAALPAPLVALAPDGTVLVLNAAVAALLGPEEATTLPGQPLAALQRALAAAGHGLAPASAWAAGLRAAQGGAPQVLEPEWTTAVLPAAAGRPAPKWWEARLEPVHAPVATTLPGRELRYILVRLLDVSEQPRMQRILEQLPLTISTMEGPNLTFTFLSAQARETMGPRAAVGRTVAESLPEVAAQGYARMLNEVRDSGKPHFGHEERSELLDPATGAMHERYHSFGFLPLRSEQGAGVLAYGLDVTEQVQARQRSEALAAEARAADQRLRRVTESLPSITFISDQAGHVLYLSPQWYAYTGTTPADNLNDVWEKHLHADDKARVRQEYAAALASGTPWRYELRLRRHDGAYRWFMSQGVPEPLEDAVAAGRSRQWFGSDLDIHELREAQRQLEAKDQQLTQILSQSPALIATVEGPDHRFAFVNAGYDELMGHRALVGHPVAECLPEVAEQGFIALLDTVYRTGQPFVGREIPISLTDPAGGQQRQLYLDFTYQLLRNDHGQVTGILAFGIDVTPQVRARHETETLQAEVRASDQRLRHQAEVLPIITFATDAVGRTTYMSPQWYAFTGQPPGGPWAEVDVEWADRLHPDDRARAQQEIQRSIDDMQLGRVEVRLRGATGDYRWFLTEAITELDADGRLSRRYGYMLDVHDLRDAQRRLELKDRQLSEILQQSPAAIATLDGPDHRFTFTNPTFNALMGGRVRVGRTVVECLPEVEEQGFIAVLDHVYRTGETYAVDEAGVTFQAPGAAERHFYLNITYQALRDQLGQITGVLSFAVDVTERVRARKKANKLAAEMLRRDEQVRAITASVPVFIFNFDQSGRITYTNPYFYEYTGLEPGTPLATAWGTLPPDDLRAVRALATRAMAAGQPWRAAFRCRRRDGELRWFQVKAQPYSDASERLAGFSAAAVEVHELQQRTEELASSRADFAALADNIAQLAWMADAEGRIFWYNQQWYNYTGSNHDAMRGAGWQQVHDPELVEGINQRYLAAIRAGQPWEDTFPLRRHDGQYRWFLSRARPIRDEATGAVVRWFGTNTDVTDLRDLQQQLSLSEVELRIQAESIPQQLWTAQPDGTTDYYNHRTAAYLGQPLTQDGVENWHRYLHPDDAASALAAWQQAVAGGRYYETEFRLRRHDGEYRWFLAQAQARCGPDGQVLKWYGTNTDVHQQRVLTAELLRREEQFRFLAESLPQMVWTATDQGANDYITQRWFDYTGLVPAESGDVANWVAVIHPDDLAPTNQRWQHSVATGEFFEIEYRFRRQDGQYRWFLGQAQAQRHADGHILKWFGSCTDIDDQKHAQQKLEAQNARLVRSNEDLDNFVYTASHDLKQPINNMAGIFEELTRTAYFRDPDAIKLITYFERALAQIFSTIDDLSAIVQGQRQQQEVPAEDVALAPLVAEVIGSLQDQVTQSGATFELDFATCPVVTFVRPNLQSLLFNLVSNSLKFAAPGRPARIRISSTPDAVTGRPILTVQDNGVGIDLERFGPQLFQLFRRFHTHVEGTGVGLYLINRIVQNHGGRLEVASSVNEGTTFQIYL